MNCKECGNPAVGVMFTKGNPDDVALCKPCGRKPKYDGWNSQSLNTANSPTGLMIRNMVKQAK
jgi:hypothetical protein